MRRAAVVLFVALAVVGCGTARFDATSEDSAKASIERLSAGMTKEQKEELAKDVMAVVFVDGMKQVFKNGLTPGKKPEFSKTEMFRSIHGLTAAEIHAKAEQVRNDMAERMKSK